eukprot:Colp12_sorted_trinity150504_noHs@4638
MLLMTGPESETLYELLANKADFARRLVTTCVLQISKSAQEHARNQEARGIALQEAEQTPESDQDFLAREERRAQRRRRVASGCEESGEDNEESEYTENENARVNRIYSRKQAAAQLTKRAQAAYELAHSTLTALVEKARVHVGELESQMTSSAANTSSAQLQEILEQRVGRARQEHAEAFRLTIDQAEETLLRLEARLAEARARAEEAHMGVLRADADREVRHLAERVTNQRRSIVSLRERSNSR